MSQNGMLVDITQCIGCYACEEACAERWGNPPPTDAHKLSSVQNTAVESFNNDEIFVPRLCMHCDDPSCVSVCPVGAFEKTPEGPVLYDADKCMGCRYCMQACPFNVPKYQWDRLNPRVTKCDRCYERKSKGGLPACAEACPTGARKYGKLDELIQEAQQRINDNPGTYYPRIYGVKEAGGTSTIYLSPKPFEELGFKTHLPNHALPDLTWEVMSKIPNYVFWGTTLLTGIWWITNRRSEVRAFEENAQPGTEKEKE